MIDQTADAVIQAFDKVVALPPVLPGTLREPVYQWLARMPGFKQGEQVAELLAHCAAKQAKGLL